MFAKFIGAITATMLLFTTALADSPRLPKGDVAIAKNCQQNIVNEIQKGMPTDNFYAELSPTLSTQELPLYTPPLKAPLIGWAADKTNYYKEWSCRSDAGIRYIRRLGIAPLGTHHEALWKDSLMMAKDEWSGGFPIIYFTQGMTHGADRPGHTSSVAPPSPYSSMFALKKAYYNSTENRWFITDELNQPRTPHGVSSQDGTGMDFIMNDYESGPGWQDVIPGWGPTANLPGSKSRIPGVSEKPIGFGIDSYPLYGNGPLGLTSIVRASPLKPPPGESVGTCIHMNPTLFDFDPTGMPRGLIARLSWGSKDQDCVLPDGRHLPVGDYVYRYVGSKDGWQLDLTNSLPGEHAINYIYGTDAHFFTGDWVGRIRELALNGSANTVLDCTNDDPKKRVAMGEPSGFEGAFIFLAAPYPYRGKAFGLDPATFVHDVYFASATDMTPTQDPNHPFIAPEVVKAYRDLLGRNPNLREGLQWTMWLHEHDNGAAEMRKRVANSIEANRKLHTLFEQIYRRPATDSEIQVRVTAQVAGDSIIGTVREWADRECR